MGTLERAARARAHGWRRNAALSLMLLSLAACGRDVAPAAPALVEGQAFPRFMLDFVASGAPAAGAQGKLLVLNVWASWCGPCRREMPGLERLSRMLDGERFVVVGMSTDSDALLASEFLLQYGISFANVLDQGGAMAKRLGLRVYPETFVIAPDGTLLRRMTGLHEWDSGAMVGMLEQLERARQPGAVMFTGKDSVYHAR